MPSLLIIKFIDQISLLCETLIFFESLLQSYIKSDAYFKNINLYIYIITPIATRISNFYWKYCYFKSLL